mmetsp:Transcript_95634/g.276314  ORF Transcript_95634/g.276314 Transcript_95634/m.276314 type:complete len:251 (+) Transcript_95634:888-1640(+)
MRRLHPVEPIPRVPMEGGARYVLRRILTAHDCVEEVQEQMLLIVDSEDGDLGVPLRHHRTQVLRDPLCLLFRGRQASLPRRVVSGLVLHSERPDGEARKLHVRNPRGDVLRPRTVRAILQARLAGRVHFPTLLHPCRRAPRSRQQTQATMRVFSLSDRSRNQGDQYALVVRQVVIEVLQLPVVWDPIEIVVTQSEVATVDVDSANRKAEARQAEVLLDNFILKVRLQLGEYRGRRFGDSAAEAYDLLTLR